MLTTNCIRDAAMRSDDCLVTNLDANIQVNTKSVSN